MLKESEIQQLFKTDDHVARVFELRENLPNLLPHCRMDEQCTRPAVIKHVDMVAGTEPSFQRDGYRAHFDGPEDTATNCGEASSSSATRCSKSTPRSSRPLPTR